MKNKSRLSRRLEKQNQKSFFLSLFGIIIIIIFLVKFGFPLLANFSLFLTESQSSSDSSDKKADVFIMAPLLNPPPSATNSAQIPISGKGSKNETINLYVNGELVDKTSTKENGDFIFDNVALSQGNNAIQIRAVSENKKESDFSDTFTVSFKNSNPSLSIDSPSDNQSFSKDDNQILVTGKTDAGDRVTVNDFWAIVDETGKFSYNLKLSDGENKIKVVTTDDAGNKTEKEIKVTYSH
ncbi:MAG: Ig-like domain-containing protein [Candidatus Levybacteria bacterium]|nr:Ig-like domain-containing protein [Candidatus Levybacteria bacterium]